MRVLVTGHDGYIGAVLMPLLSAAGHEVVGLDNHLFGECAFGAVPEVEALSMDVRDVRAEHLGGFDAVMHLAAISNDPIGDLNPDVTYDINHRASVRLAEAAKEAGVQRFIFSSSCSLYGAAAAPTRSTRPPAFNPVTPYGESKVLAERDICRSPTTPSPDVPAQRHRLRRLAADARRPRGQQPRRPTRTPPARCGCRATAALAAARAHRGHPRRSSPASRPR